MEHQIPMPVGESRDVHRDAGDGNGRRWKSEAYMASRSDVRALLRIRTLDVQPLAALHRPANEHTKPLECMEHL